MSQPYPAEPLIPGVQAEIDEIDAELARLDDTLQIDCVRKARELLSDLTAPVYQSIAVQCPGFLTPPRARQFQLNQKRLFGWIRPLGYTEALKALQAALASYLFNLEQQTPMGTPYTRQKARLLKQRGKVLHWQFAERDEHDA